MTLEATLLRAGQRFGPSPHYQMETWKQAILPIGDIGIQYVERGKPSARALVETLPQGVFLPERLHAYAIHSFEVPSNRRGRGLGTRAAKELIERYNDRPILLETASHRAAQFWQRLGWVPYVPQSPISRPPGYSMWVRCGSHSLRQATAEDRMDAWKHIGR